MFSVVSLTRAAKRAISATASSVNESETPSVPRRSRYCRTSAFCGSVRIRRRSSSPREASSTRIGKRPCSSGMRSVGLLTWKAPAAMKRTWSVRTGPYFVETVVPSTIGRRSRCTPSRETSGPWTLSRPAILSISSRNTIPADSARSTASRETWSWSTRRASSSWRSTVARLRDRERPPLRAAAEEAGEHVADGHVHLLRALAAEDLEGGHRALGHVHLDGARLELAGPQLRAQLLARGELRLAPGLVRLRRFARDRPRRGQEEVQQPLLDPRLRLLPDLGLLLAAHHVDRRRHEVAHDRVHVAAHVAHLGELRGLDLDEGAPRQLGEAARDLGLAHPGGPDHQDVLGGDVGGDRRGEPAAADAAAQRDRHRALGRRLAHHPAVELGHDLARGERVQRPALLARGAGARRHPSSVSTSTASFV